jgi:hypothetical protein
MFPQKSPVVDPFVRWDSPFRCHSEAFEHEAPARMASAARKRGARAVSNVYGPRNLSGPDLQHPLSASAKNALPVFNHLRTLCFTLLHSQNGKAPVFNPLRTLGPKTPGVGGPFMKHWVNSYIAGSPGGTAERSPARNRGPQNAPFLRVLRWWKRWEVCEDPRKPRWGGT